MKYIAVVSITLSSGKKISRTIGPFRARNGKSPEHVALETASVALNNYDYDYEEMVVESIEPVEQKGI